MKKRTVVIFGSLIAAVVGAVVYFQFHQQHLLSVAGGSMSMETKKKFWSHGIDCQEVWEVQGYETLDTLIKMFTITQHQFYQLNPGVGMNLKQGEIICVKGIYDVSTHAMTPIWPIAIGGVLAVAGIGAAMYARLSAPR